MQIYVRDENNKLSKLTYDAKNLSFTGGMLLVKDEDEFKKELLVAAFAPEQWVFVEVIRETK